MSQNFKFSTLIVAAVTILSVSWLIWYGDDHAGHAPPGNFIVKPYLQLGSKGGLVIVWQVSGEGKDDWTFEVQDQGQNWKRMDSVSKRLVRVDSIEPFTLYMADVTELGAKAFDYRVLKNKNVEFSAHAEARMDSPDHLKFVVMGDCGADTIGQKKIAYQIMQIKPNLVLIVGDIVYDCGRAKEYLHHFFPIYNRDELSKTEGVPMMRSILVTALPGNHDIAKSSLFDVRNLSLFSDSLAYFYEWQQPLNGPGRDGAPNTPELLHNPTRAQRFRTAAGANYPTMATFFFDLGDARFVCLDGDHYMNWQDPLWRNWLDKTLAGAANKKFRFVLYHQTAFSSDTEHFSEQRMRLISDILEKNDVRMVFAGHVHNYQRTYPLHFAPQRIDKRGFVSGAFEIAARGKAPHAGEIVYITTGGGGNTLDGGMISKHPTSWQPFTQKFIADTHTFTLCELKGGQLLTKQISEDGVVLDEFTMSATSFPSVTTSVQPSPTLVPTTK